MLQYDLKIATKEDIDSILSLMLKFKEESVYKALETDIEAIKYTIEEYLLRSSKEAIIILAFIERKPIGIIVGTSSRLPFNRELQAAETYWYVLPEYREERVGLELYETFMFWATDVVNARVIHTASPNGSNLNRIYEKQGYQLVEELYFKVI